jgi:hypothetical protein
MKVLFLDIDGVLNGHEWMAEAGSCAIDRACVQRLNRVLYATDAELVISSAWRYMILNGAMTFDGFQYLLRTHGLAGSAKIRDTTTSDEHVEGRANQIAHYLKLRHPASFVIIDDDHIEGFPCRVVQTNGKIGLTDSDADDAIRILGANQ